MCRYAVLLESLELEPKHLQSYQLSINNQAEGLITNLTSPIFRPRQTHWLGDWVSLPSVHTFLSTVQTLRIRHSHQFLDCPKMIIHNYSSATLATTNNDILSSLQNEVRSLKAIAAVSLVVALLIVFLIVGSLFYFLYWRRHHRKQQKRSNPSREVGTDHLPDPNEFELSNINRQHRSSNDAQDANSSTFVYGNLSQPKPQEHSPYPAQPSQTASPHNTASARDGKSLPGPVMFSPLDRLTREVQQSNEGQIVRRNVSVPLVETTVPAPIRPRRARTETLQPSSYEPSNGTDYSKVRRATRYGEEYLCGQQNGTRTPGRYDEPNEYGSSSRYANSRAGRMQDKIENQ